MENWLDTIAEGIQQLIKINFLTTEYVEITGQMDAAFYGFYGRRYLEITDSSALTEQISQN